MHHIPHRILHWLTLAFQGLQYVTAGDLLALQTLTNVLNYLKKENIDLQKVRQGFPTKNDTDEPHVH